MKTQKYFEVMLNIIEISVGQEKKNLINGISWLKQESKSSASFYLELLWKILEKKLIKKLIMKKIIKIIITNKKAYWKRVKRN